MHQKQILTLSNRLHRNHAQGLEKTRNEVEIYNVGSEDQIPAIKIANIVAEEMDLEKSSSTCTGGVDDGRAGKATPKTCS
jgi:nucleoside-diphosphate-sugar epimerase